jgi:hypothetical protein
MTQEVKRGPFRFEDDVITLNELSVTDEEWTMDAYYHVITSTTGQSTLKFQMSLDAPYELRKSYDLFAGVALGLNDYLGSE